MPIWRKMGRVFVPRSTHPKLLTHAANPVAVRLEKDVYRVFYSGRDVSNRSSVGVFDLDVLSGHVLAAPDEPLFVHGAPGTFYADGVSPGSCYEVGGRRYILFMGWQTPAHGHWRGDIGRLVLGDDSTSLRLDGCGPLMGSDATDPVSLSYPWVLQEPGMDYVMWYGSTVHWEAGNGEMLHVIKHAVSRDGDLWSRTGATVPFGLGTAQAFSRPSVIGDVRRGYAMWFSYRSGTGQSYRIGYATSPNGTGWTLRLDEAGIDVSQEGWDSDMIEYPFVFEHGGRRLMLYNGNGFGRSGIGLAVLERD